jgi:hypothetical protein
MTTNSLVLKATICPEWYDSMKLYNDSINHTYRFSERIMPWVHYVPVRVVTSRALWFTYQIQVKMDLTDLYDIMAFFRGDGASNPGHDDLASNIAAAGKQWSNTFWRKEDQTAYMFR